MHPWSHQCQAGCSWRLGASPESGELWPTPAVSFCLPGHCCPIIKHHVSCTPVFRKEWWAFQLPSESSVPRATRVPSARAAGQRKALRRGTRPQSSLQWPALALGGGHWEQPWVVQQAGTRNSAAGPGKAASDPCHVWGERVLSHGLCASVALTSFGCSFEKWPQLSAEHRCPSLVPQLPPLPELSRGPAVNESLRRGKQGSDPRALWGLMMTPRHFLRVPGLGWAC